ncbi:MAG TPA: polysaccharide biosynthesis tyrosine autokinase [Terriglobia bacterium]|nr:polysaccharide biosynthesis tyrosine autokinase [Terriglobia bacterium]
MSEHDRLGSRSPAPLVQVREQSIGPVIDLDAGDVQSYPTLRAYYNLLSRRRWELLGTVVAVLVPVAIYSFKVIPVYRATARMEIEADTAQIRSLNDYDRDLPTSEAFLKTQVKVLESDDLAWEVIQQTGLAQAPDFARPAGVREETILSTRTAQARLIAKFLDRLTVQLDPGTHMMEVSFDSTDPDQAARVANELVKDYVEYSFHQKYDATRQASEWMEQQLDELKAKVESSQQALVNYERANSIVNVNDKQSVSEERLADLSKDLTAAESDRAEKESLYNTVKSDPTHAAELADDSLLEQLEAKYADAQAEYIEAQDTYGPNFPKVIRLRDRATGLRQLIERERKQVIDRVENSYRAALDRERLLRDTVARQKVEVGNLNQLLIQHNLLKREFETNQQLYDSLLQRLKDATVSAGLRATNIHVVDSARPPADPVRPRKVRNLAVGLMIGFLLGVALVFAHESLEHATVKTAEDVERLVHAPSLAVIPAVSSRSYPVPPIKHRGPKELKDGVVALALLDRPTSPLAESYRALRSALLFSTVPAPQILLVTSSRPSEGKTSTAVNLGLAFAQNGARVLLIDSDLRAFGVTRALGLPNDRGLSGVLTGAYSLDEAIEQLDSLGDLWVLPAGPRAPNPAELLSSSIMERLLEELRPRFDHVVFDSPPLLLVTDATILSTLTDGVILVVESGVTTPDALIQAHRTLKSAGARVLGVAVNKVDTKRDGCYYTYYERVYGEDAGSSDSRFH